MMAHATGREPPHMCGLICTGRFALRAIVGYNRGIPWKVALKPGLLVTQRVSEVLS